MRQPLALNPLLDATSLAARFRADRRLQIDDFLSLGSAGSLRDELMASSRWRHVIKGGSQVFEIARSDFEAMPAVERNRLDEAVHAAAVRGFQFRYDLIRVPDDGSERARAGTRLNEFAALMSSPDTLAFLRTITGAEKIDFADAQATLYRPGDFLTRHDDNVDGKFRQLAYVLSLTPDWQAEWGGLLLFNDDQGRLADAFVPRFNTLSIFSVPQPHSVSFVAPFAPVPRLSVTGWLRATKP